MINFKKGLSTPLVITIIIVLAVLVGGGILAYQYYYLPKQEKETEIPEIKTPETPKDETSDWKTYRNEEYGFEIKYPEDYKTKEIPIDMPTGLSISLDKGSIAIQEIDNSIININLPEDCMFNSSALEEKNMLSFIGTKEVNGINFYYYKNYPEYIGGYCGMSAGCWYKDVYRTLYNGNCYQIVYDRSHRSFIGGNVQEIPEVFNQILSTFQFID